MHRKLILSLAAVATLAAAALAASTEANAFRPGGISGGAVARAHVGGGRHVGVTRHAGIRHVGMRHHFRHHFRPHFRPHFRHHVRFWPRPFCWRFPWRCRGPIYTRYIAPAYVAAAPVAYAAAPAPRCTCLTKEYLADGGVLFKDVCTKEEALMPNPNQQQSQAPYPTPQVN